MQASIFLWPGSVKKEQDEGRKNSMCLVSSMWINKYTHVIKAAFWWVNNRKFMRQGPSLHGRDDTHWMHSSSPE